MSMPNGSYVYTLTRAVRHRADANNGANTEKSRELQLPGDRRRRQQRDRHDQDRHRRRRSDGDADTNSVVEGAIVTGNVLTGGPPTCSGRTVRRTVPAAA